jgi:predicted ATPase/DNA-binding winged helix-turn-helix (wHTH) protein
MEQIGNLSVDFLQRIVVDNGQVKKVGARALDILELLVQARGALVTKDEIMRVVWPRVVVEENNVQVQVNALRKLLGSQRDLIKTESGRGYRLLSPDHAADVNGDLARTLLPGPSSLYGRDDALASLISRFNESSTITLTGPGGIGKTRLALEAARSLAASYPGGVIVVDLSSVTDEKFTISAIAAAGAAAGLRKCVPNASLQLLAEALRGEQRLLVLDNCEHVLAEAARVVSAISEVGCSVLATSRAPLRVPNERVFVVSPLAVPESNATVSEMSRAKVVEFFVARTQAVQPHFQVTEANVSGICQICRALDGLPLAIELAAARAAVLGIDVVAANLDDRMRLLTGGYRASLPRHQTMRAALDWSYRLLGDIESTLFRKLAVFVGSFSFDAVRYIMKPSNVSDATVLDAFEGLISKSLVTASIDGDTGRFRLLETTRQYALLQLDANGERTSACRIHADFLVEVFQRERATWQSKSDTQHMSLFSIELDNIRSALDWAFSSNTEIETGLALAAETLPYLFELSLVGECRERAEIVLRAWEGAEQTAADAARLLAVRAALGSSLVYTNGPDSTTRELWHQVYRESSRIGEVRLQTRALWGIWNAHLYGGEPQLALKSADQFYGLARDLGDTTHTLLGMRIRAISLHYLGKQVAARELLESMLRQYDPALHRWNSIGFRIDQGIVSRATLARVLWTLGALDEAERTAQEALRAAIAYGNEMVLCYVLVEALIPICAFNSQSSGASGALELLETTANHMSFQIWSFACEAFGRCRHALAFPSPGSLLAAELSVSRLTEIGFLAPWSFLVGQLALAYLRAGDRAKADACVTRAIERCEATGEQWFYPELCRIKAEAQRAHAPGTALVWLAKGWNSARAQSARRMEDNIRCAIAALIEGSGIPAEDAETAIEALPTSMEFLSRVS